MGKFTPDSKEKIFPLQAVIGLSIIIFFSFNDINAEEKAETLTCGLKTITLQDGKINQIRHEDGTFHSGSSISDNWSYDGKSIKHRLMDELIPCDTKPKTRSEIISELSSRFIKNPSIHGMDKEEAKLMASYTANLMKTDENCYLLVDSSKSIERKEMYFIDCNDHSGNPHRYWVSHGDLIAGNLRSSETPVSEAKQLIFVIRNYVQRQLIQQLTILHC